MPTHKSTYVTTRLFKKEAQKLHTETQKLHTETQKLHTETQKLHAETQKINASVENLTARLDRLTLVVIKNTEDITEMKATMATKDDINRIINHMDELALKSTVVQQNWSYSDQRLKLLEPQVAAHEKRISALEKK